MGLMDVVDEHDNIVDVLPREEIYARGLLFRTANIFVYDAAGLIYVPTRTLDKRIFPGCYDFSAAEHVESGEDYESAAHRALREELNLTGISLRQLKKFTPAEGVVGFSMLFDAQYDGEIDFNRKDFTSISLLSGRRLAALLKEQPTRFKSDFHVIFPWYYLMGESQHA